MRTAGQPQPGMPEDVDTAARRYWSAWTDALRAATQGATPASDAAPWQQQIDWWTTMAKGGGQPASDDTLDRFNAQARQWFGTMQQVAAQFAGRDAGPADIASAWRQAMGSMGAGAGTPMGTASMGGFGASPFMQGVGAMPGMAGMSAMPGMPGFGAMPGMDANPFAAMMQGMQQSPGMHGFDQWYAQVAPWLKTLQGGMPAMPAMPDMASFFQTPSMPSTPTFGHNRERDARWQALARAMADLQQRMQAYAALMQRATQDAFALFEGKLAEHEEPGRQLTSGRALFDVWIDSAEDAYARIALTEEFRSVYGALVDAQMRVRGGVQVEVEHACAQLGMPTRTELDGAHRKIVELERQMRRLRDATSTRAAHIPAASARPAAAEPRTTRAAKAPPEASIVAPRTSASVIPAPTGAVVTKAGNGAATAQKRAAKTSAKKAAKKAAKAAKKASKKSVTAATKAAKKPAKAAKDRAKKTTKTPVARTSGSKKATSVARTRAVAAVPLAKTSVAKKRASTTKQSASKTSSRVRTSTRRQAAASTARRASPAPTRSAAKRAAPPPSRRGAMSVFVDTPMPVAPASLKRKR